MKLLLALLLPLLAPSAPSAPSAPAPLVQPLRGGDETAAPARPSNRDPVVEGVLELGITDNRVQEHLDHLVNAIGPRLTSSTNLERAERWCKNQLAEWGLDARLERWGTWPVGFDRHSMSGRMLAPEELELVFTTPAWTPGTDGPARGPAVFEPRDLAELDAMADRLRGAWVVVRPLSDRGSRADRRAVDAELDRMGILGEVHAAGNKTLVHTSGNENVTWDDLPVRVSIHLQGEQFAKLREHLEAGADVELEIDVRASFRKGPIALHNVIADLPGTEFPDQYVIVGGHLDSWDGATGTCDNGTGVATTLEAARLLVAAGAQPRRTIRFALWSGEEQGLFGSRRYVAEHPELMDRISAVLIHDGGTNYLSGLAGPPALVEDLRWSTEPLVDLDPAMPFEVAENEGLSRRAGSSDHAPFLQAGVPGFFWRQAGRSDYDYVHHTQHDVFEQAIPEYQEHSAIVVAVTAYNLANLDGLLDRTGLYRAEPFRRRMGVGLEENQVTSVAEGSKAAEAGWQAGDVIVAIDDVEVATRRDIVRALRAGGPVKNVRLLRGEEELVSVLDYTAEEAEHARQEALARGEAVPADGGETPAPAADEPAEEPAPTGGR